MQLILERKLESTNSWSRHRTLQVRLNDTPRTLPLTTHANALLQSLMQLTLPPHRTISAFSPKFVEGGEGTHQRWGHLVAMVAIEFLHAVGLPRLRGFVATTAEGDDRIALECFEFEVAAAALQAAVGLVDQVLKTGTCDAVHGLSIVDAADDQYSLGDATGPIVAAARRYGLPVLRLDGESRVQIGEGIYARRIRKAATDSTGFIAEQTSTDKAYTKELWSRLGIPVASGRVVADADDAVQLSEELGWPVVVKPLDSDYSRGVTLNVRDPAGVRAGFDVARQESESVIVERSLEGCVHRLLVVNDRVISAIRRDPAGVTGDGRSTICELVDLENQSPRRGADHRWPLQRLTLGPEELEFLKEQGWSSDSIPNAGQRVEIRREPFLTTGGESHEVLDRVHPETLDAICDAVRVIGLDVAGVDLIARDISIPLSEQGGGLLEVNAQPAICLHLAPFSDHPQAVGEAIIESMFPAGATGQVPLTIVVGNPSYAELHRFAQKPGQAVAISTPAETRILGRNANPASSRPADRLAAVNLHPRTSATCLALTLDSLLESGLGTDHCRMLVLDDAESQVEGAERSVIQGLLRRMVEMADTCLVNCDDSRWMTLVEGTGSPSLVLASRDAGHPDLQSHLRSGGRILTCENSEVVLRSASAELARFPSALTDGESNWLVAASAPDRCLPSCRDLPRWTECLR